MHTLAQLKSGELAGITTLTLSENLTEFPLEILTLSDTLEVLDLSNNALLSLPSDMAKLHKLKILFASQNNFTHLPEVIGELPNLEMVGFKSNQITRVSETSLPQKLRWLILTDNEITKLPNSLGHRPRLQKLALAGNKLTELPETLANAHNLELIRISANELTHCPEQLLSLPKLAWIAFSGNPFSKVNHEEQHEAVPEISSSHYTFNHILGQGASGIISKASWLSESFAKQMQFPNDIAVKVFKGEVTSDGYPEDELQACLQVGIHKNLVQSIAQVSEKDHLALVMKLIPSYYKNLGLPPCFKSCTRDTFPQGSSLSIEIINTMVTQMDNVFNHMHQQQVCHGDLYAHNTLYDETTGDIIFGDFGAASRYQMLTVGQKEKIKLIEQRAFHHFIEDLLSICASNDKESETYLALAERVQG